MRHLLYLAVVATGVASMVPAWIGPRASADIETASTAPSTSPGPLIARAPATAASAPATPATAATLPAADFPESAGRTFRLKPTPPLPAIYRILLTRSLFSRERQVATASMAGHVVSGGNSAEATLVFRGAGVSDDRRSAYIENMATKQITRHHQGEPTRSTSPRRPRRWS